MAREPISLDDLNAPKTAKAAQAQVRQKPKTVRVMSKHGLFVDLIKDVKITSEPVEVEDHDWLRANIDAGILIEV